MKIPTKRAIRIMLAVSLFIGLSLTRSRTVEAFEVPKKRVLLLWQRPDGHPETTHEYETGILLIANWLQKNTSHQVIVSQADPPWSDGPELLNHADGVVMFVSQGAKWIREDKARLRAFQELAQRGGGFSVLHWGMGTKQAEDVPDFVALFGASHGGPDRKYKFLTTSVRPAPGEHPVQRGLKGIDQIEDEFYYALKLGAPVESITPLLQAKIDDDWQMVSWAFERTGGGRSFGFSGLHFHRNWNEEPYRRLVFQGILWTLGDEIPKAGLNVDIDPDWLKLPQREPSTK